jgi:NADPH2:quinone reductase
VRAVRVHELTGPAALRVEELPDPPAPSPGEIAIDVRAAGVNFPDVLLSQGKYHFKPPPPFILGGEAAGVVTAVGAPNGPIAVGDRVAIAFTHGAFAEKIVMPDAIALRLPDHVSFEVGAVTFFTYLTTMHALVDRGRLATGETLLVLGAAGGVGVAAIQIGKALGARVIAAASTDDKLAFCKDNGADDTINYAKVDLKDAVRALTHGAGADVVYDPVGGAWAESALRATAWDGRYLVLGFASGDIPKIPLNLPLLKGCAIVGVFFGQFAMREPERNRAHAARLFEWLGQGKVTPRIDAVLPFAQAAEALGRLERREVKGKIVLVP